MHTERTQYAHTQDTENNAQRTQNNTLVHTNTHKYSFDFIVEDYISKNSIIQLYTNIIYFGHLIDEVSK